MLNRYMLTRLLRHKKLVLLFIGVVLIFIVYFAYILNIRMDKIEKYNEANFCIDNEQYDEAIELLEEIDPFRDSDELIAYAKKGVRYNEAKDYETREEYEAAIIIYREIIDFGDSEDRIEMLLKASSKEIDDALAKAIKDYENGEYREALIEFRVLPKSEIVTEYISKCKEKIIKEMSQSISAGVQYSLGITDKDEVVLAWNNNEFDFTGWNDIASISGKGGIVLGLNNCGKVYYDSTNEYKKDYDADKDKEIINAWNERDTEVIQIAAGEMNAFVLFLDGKVDGVGRNTYKADCEFREWNNVSQIASSRRTLVAYTDNQELLFYGNREEDLRKLYYNHENEWRDVKKIIVGGDENPYVIGLKKDGTIVGLLGLVESNIELLKDEWLGHITDIAAGDLHTIVILDNERVDISGDTGILDYEKDVREKVWECINPVEISAGDHLSLALSSDGKVYASGYDHNGQGAAKEWNNIRVW